MQRMFATSPTFYLKDSLVYCNQFVGMGDNKAFSQKFEEVAIAPIRGLLKKLDLIRKKSYLSQ